MVRGAVRWLVRFASPSLLLLPACMTAPRTNPRTAPSTLLSSAGSQSIVAATTRIEAIRVEYPAPSLSWLPVKMAETTGLFVAEGLEATFVQTTSTNLIAGLLSRELDYSVDLTAVAQAAMPQEVPLRLLMAVSVRPQHCLMARSEIPTITDLSGRVVGINQHRDFTEWETRVVLKRDGVPSDEVRFLAIPTSPARLAGLDIEQLAAAIMAAPLDLEAEVRGHHKLDRISRESDITWIGLATQMRFIQG